MVAAETFRVTIDATDHSITPGQSLTVPATIYNAATVVDEFVVDGVAGAEGWVTSDPPQVSLLPDNEGVTQVTLTVPEGAPLLAGRHTVGLRFHSVRNPARSYVAELHLNVAPITQAAVVVEPQLVRAGREGRFTARVDNGSNHPLDVDLQGDDPEKAVDFRIAPDSLHVPPGQRGFASIRAFAKRPLTGEPMQRTLSVRAWWEGGEQTTAATLVQKPLLPKAALAAFGVALPVLLAIGGFLLTRDDGGEGTETAAETATTTTQAVGNPDVTEVTGTQVELPVDGGNGTDDQTEVSPTPTDGDGEDEPPASAVVPDVTGLTEAEAAAALEGADLQAGETTEEPSDSQEAGRVVEQGIDPGSEVDIGTTIDLVVSTGPPEPDVLIAAEVDVDQTFTIDLEPDETEGGNDLWFQAETADLRFLKPLFAELALMPGDEEPGYADCRDADLSGDRIPMSQLSEGSHLCASTSEGRVARIEIIALPGPSPGTLTIDYTTWQLAQQ